MSDLFRSLLPPALRATAESERKVNGGVSAATAAAIAAVLREQAERMRLIMGYIPSRHDDTPNRQIEGYSVSFMAWLDNDPIAVGCYIIFEPQHDDGRPSEAVFRVEVLREGALAYYGVDEKDLSSDQQAIALAIIVAYHQQLIIEGRQPAMEEANV